MRVMRNYVVKELARARGWNQLDLFERCKDEVSLTFIQRLWQNRVPAGVRLKNLEAVARALEVEVKDLFVDTPSSESQPAPVGNRKSLAGAAA